MVSRDWTLPCLTQRRSSWRVASWPVLTSELTSDCLLIVNWFKPWQQLILAYLIYLNILLNCLEYLYSERRKFLGPLRRYRAVSCNMVLASWVYRPWKWVQLSAQQIPWPHCFFSLFPRLIPRFKIWAGSRDPRKYLSLILNNRPPPSLALHPRM